MILIIIISIISLAIILLFKFLFKDKFIDKNHINYFNERIPDKLIPKIEKVNDKYNNIKIYIVNLEKHYDRKLHMINLMNNFGFKNYEFITPISLDIIKNDSQYKKWNISYNKISHVLTFLYIFKKNQYKYFFIMEDDIDAYSDISINKILDNSIKYNFDLLYLEMCYINCKKTKLLEDNIYSIISPSCAACILYNKNFTDNILKIYDEYQYDYITKNIDIDVVYDKIQNIFNYTYIGFPYFRQNPIFESSLPGSMRYKKKNQHFDKICK